MTLRSLLTTTRYPARTADPFYALRALNGSLEDVFGGLVAANGLTEAAAMPVRLDVREDDKAYHVSADLPGLSEKEVEVTFDDGLLTLRGEKKITRDEKKDTWHVTERSYGSFARQLSLSAAVDAEKIEAKFDKGVLNITLPKMPQEQSGGRKIEIRAA